MRIFLNPTKQHKVDIRQTDKRRVITNPENRIYMSTIPTHVLLKQLKNLLREGIQGPEKGWSYFTDPDSKGVLGTIEKLSSAAASKTSGPNDNSIAAHAWHLSFALRATSDLIQADHSPKDWEESWRVQKVNDSEWKKIRWKLQQEYEDFFRVIETVDLSNEKMLSGVIGAIAHVAYHLGAIRQKLTENDLKKGT